MYFSVLVYPKLMWQRCLRDGEGLLLTNHKQNFYQCHFENMINFTIKLLLAFVPTKSKEKNDQITHKTANPELSYVLRLEKTPSCAHVEYQLLPTNKPYKIDVLCWSRAAKVDHSSYYHFNLTISRRFTP